MKQIWNPIFPLHEYVPDGEPHVFGDRVYVFGSHDKEGGEKYCPLGDYDISVAVCDTPAGRYEYHGNVRNPDGSILHRFLPADPAVINDGGVIISNCDVEYYGRKQEDAVNLSGTNHGSIENIGGKWYVFYHRLTHGSDYSRQACAEEIRILPDGSIPQVEVTTQGLNGGALEGSGSYPAAIACQVTNGHMPNIRC